MKILYFGASNHSRSINAALARFAAHRAKEKYAPHVVLEGVDLNDFEMPIYSIDREDADGIPTHAKDLFAMIGATDALIISFAEYNGSYTSAWKNIFDWMSRIDAKVFQGRRLLALSATPGPRAGAGVLAAATTAAPFFGADLRGQVGVGRWGEAFDPETTRLASEPDLHALDEALVALLEE